MTWIPPSMPWYQPDTAKKIIETQELLGSQLPPINPILKAQELIGAQTFLPEEQIKLISEIQGISEIGCQAALGFESKPPILGTVLDGVGANIINPQFPLLREKIGADAALRAAEFYRIDTPIVTNIKRGFGALSLINDIVSSAATQAYIAQLTPLIGTVIPDGADLLSWDIIEQRQNECARALLEVEWCPAVAVLLPIGQLVPLCEIASRNQDETKREEALSQFVFRHMGMRYTDNLLEDLKNFNISKHLRRLLKETIYAYRRKENGIVATVLPTLWEGIIRDKAQIESNVQTSILKEKVEAFVDDAYYPKAISEFYKTCILYPCKKAADVKSNVPGRHATAHGWFVEYPTKKAALNAILFTDFLLRLEQF